MEPTSSISPDEARRTLESVQATRSATQGRLGPYWFALVVFGVLTMVSSQFFEIRNGAGVALFWLVAGPLGLVVVARHQRAQVLAVGAARARRPYALMIGGIAGAGFLVGVLGAVTGEGRIALCGAPLAVGVLYFAFAWLRRSVVYAAWATVLVAMTAFAVVADLSGVSAALAIGLGGNLIFLGRDERRRQAA